MAQSSSGCHTLDATLLDTIPLEVPPQRRMIFGLLLALATLLQVTMAGWGPVDNGQEGWNAAVARQLALGQTPTMISENWGRPVHPTLATLLTAQSFRWLGCTEFAARFPAALAVLGICGLVYLIAERGGGMNRGLIAGVVAVTMSGPLLHGKNAGGSSIFAFFLVLGFYALARMLEQRPHRLKWVALWWLATVGAVWSGSVAGWLMPLATLLPLLILFREARMRLTVFVSHPGLVLLTFAIGAFYLWQRTDHSMPVFPESAHSLAGVFWMLFPWSVILLLPFLWRSGKILRLREMECGEAMIWSWLVVAALWVSIGGMHDEWPPALATLWPVVALVSALIWERLNSGLRMLGCGLLVLAGAIGMSFCGQVAGKEWLHLLRPIWWLSCAVMMVFGVAALIFIRQRHSLAALLALAAAVIPLSFNLLDARARHTWDRSFRDIASVLNVHGEEAPTVFLDDQPGAVSGFLFYAPGETRMRFGETTTWKGPHFVLTPKTHAEMWQRLYPGAARIRENATHCLLRLPG